MGGNGLRSVLPTLLAERVVATVEVGGETRYRLPMAEDDHRTASAPVRRVAVPAFDPVALRQKVESVLASGASYALNEIVLSARHTIVHANAENVAAVLDELDRAGRVRRIPIGSFVRYQAIARVATGGGRL